MVNPFGATLPPSEGAAWRNAKVNQANSEPLYSCAEESGIYLALATAPCGQC